MKKQNQQGFTLIELMIVIAIIGILASIAIPQYQIYTQRTEATTSIAGVRTVQLAIQEFYSNNGSTPGLLTDLNAFGIDAQSLVDIAAANTIVASVTTVFVAGPAGTADIVITYDAVGTAPADLATLTVVLRGTAAAGIMTFTVDGTSTVDQKFWPKL